MEKASGHLNAAKSYYKNKQFDKAEKEALLAVAAVKIPQTKALCGLRALKVVIALRKSRRILTKLARKNPDVHSGALAAAYYKLGLVYLRAKLVKSAISNLAFAGELYKRQKNPDYKALADIYKILGKQYRRSYSLHYLNEATQFAALITDEDARMLHSAELHEAYGNTYSKTKQYADAERLYLNACKAYASLDGGKCYLIESATNFINAAAAAQKLHEHERAHSHARRAIDMLYGNHPPEGREDDWKRVKRLIEKALEK